MAKDALAAALYHGGTMKNRLKEIRKDRGLTLETVATALGTSHGTISRLESGKRRLDDVWIGKFVKFYRIHPGEIFAPLPELEKLTKAERMAAQLARRMQPDQRATWFQVGNQFVEPASPNGGETRRDASK